MNDYFATERLRSIYNDFAAEYDKGRTFFNNQPQLQELTALLRQTADVLDAGCGSGTPFLRHFAREGHRVTGTDISPAMLERAQHNVPQARLVEADSAALPFEDQSFDLITSIYSLFHLGMDRQQKAFAEFFRLLRPGGYAYFTLACEAYTGAPAFTGTKVFAGIEMPYSHVTPEAYQQQLQTLGFQITKAELLNIGDETMLWMLVHKSRPA